MAAKAERGREPKPFSRVCSSLKSNACAPLSINGGCNYTILAVYHRIDGILLASCKFDQRQLFKNNFRARVKAN